MAKSPVGPTRNNTLSLAFVVAVFVRMTLAVLIAFIGMIALKSARRSPQAWVARLVVAMVAFVAALWIVVRSLPFPVDPGIPTFTIVGSAVIITGLAVEELVGADVRRLLGI